MELLSSQDCQRLLRLRPLDRIRRRPCTRLCNTLDRPDLWKLLVPKFSGSTSRSMGLAAPVSGPSATYAPLPEQATLPTTGDKAETHRTAHVGIPGFPSIVSDRRHLSGILTNAFPGNCLGILAALADTEILRTHCCLHPSEECLHEIFGANSFKTSRSSPTMSPSPSPSPQGLTSPPDFGLPRHEDRTLATRRLRLNAEPLDAPEMDPDVEDLTLTLGVSAKGLLWGCGMTPVRARMRLTRPRVVFQMRISAHESASILAVLSILTRSESKGLEPVPNGHTSPARIRRQGLSISSSCLLDCRCPGISR